MDDTAHSTSDQHLIWFARPKNRPDEVSGPHRHRISRYLCGGARSRFMGGCRSVRQLQGGGALQPIGTTEWKYLTRHDGRVFSAINAERFQECFTEMGAKTGVFKHSRVILC